MTRLLLIVAFLWIPLGLYAQDGVLLTPYNTWNESELYVAGSQAHTAFKPILYEDTARQHGTGSLLKRKIFDEHLLIFEKKDFHLFVDFLPDFQVGSSRREQTVPWQNTRGFRISGNIGRKVYFESEDYESQEAFPGYVDSFVRQRKVIPRLDNFRKLPSNSSGVFDFNYASARLVYMPNHLLQFDLGYGKNFIGDGYRSLLLSDWSFNYPYLRVTANWRDFQYSVMWSQYLNTWNSPDKNIFSFPKKWGQTFFLDWHFNRNGNLGLFESVIWPDQDINHRKDINWTFLSPVLFLHGTQSPSGTDNYTLTGLNAKYKVLPRTFLYGQLAVSNFLRNGDWTQRFAAQAGLRSASVFGVQGLNVTGEYNMARPYMYAGRDSGINYTHFNQPLADPLGNAFEEGLIVLTYQYGKWWFRAEGLGAVYLPDTAAGMNAGGDMFKPLPGPGAVNGKGLRTTLLLGDFRVAYILNPRINLRIEAGVTLRKASNEQHTFRDQVFMLGLRSSFRDLIYDF